MPSEKLRSFTNIAKLIRQKRLSHPKGYSQSELSHLLGYKNGQFISNVERSLCSIPLKMLRKVSLILNIDSRELKEVILKDYELTLDNYLEQADGQVQTETNTNNEVERTTSNMTDGGSLYSRAD